MVLSSPDLEFALLTECVKREITVRNIDDVADCRTNDCGIKMMMMEIILVFWQVYKELCF